MSTFERRCHYNIVLPNCEYLIKIIILLLYIRLSFARQPGLPPPDVWTETEKLQLAEAIDMYGIGHPARIVTRVPTKKLKQVQLKLRQIEVECRKEGDCADMNVMRFVDLNEMNDLFLVSGAKPKDVMVKWMEYLEMYYDKDPSKYDKFKLFSRAFLIMSECTPPPKTLPDATNNVIDFR